MKQQDHSCVMDWRMGSQLLVSARRLSDADANADAVAEAAAHNRKTTPLLP